MARAVALMLEMFPACTVSRAEEALRMALGDVEEAAQLLLQERAQPGTRSSTTTQVGHPGGGGWGGSARWEALLSSTPTWRAPVHLPVFRVPLSVGLVK